MSIILDEMSYGFESFCDNLGLQHVYWGLTAEAARSWFFRMTLNKAEFFRQNSPYNDKANWSRMGRNIPTVRNFWRAVNFGFIDMTEEFFSSFRE